MADMVSPDNEPFDIKNKDNNACCWDLEHFDGIAFTYPHGYNTRKQHWMTDRYYCSPECSLASLLSKGGNIYRKRELFKDLLKTVYGISTRVVPAPPRECLKRFDKKNGLDITEFRKKSNFRYRIVEPPEMVITTKIWKLQTAIEKAEIATQRKRSRHGTSSLDNFFCVKK